MLELKTKHRSANDIANQKVLKKNDELSLMHEWVEEMALEVKQSKRKIKLEQKNMESESVKSTKRLKVELYLYG